MGSSNNERITLPEFMEIQAYSLIILAGLLFLITVSNLRFLDSLEDSCDSFDKLSDYPCVSILIPARNEEDYIEQCLRGLISQTYAPLEILVLDDQSTDRTKEVVQNIVEVDSRVKLVSGSKLPIGWVGKNWACHQLSEKATGDLLLFVDADTILSEGTIAAAVTDSIKNEVDLLAVMPRRVAGCISERLMFPFIDWAAFCWMPMKQAHKSGSPHLSAAFGQFMLFKREAYESIGGHAAVKTTPLDDLGLVRLTKKIGLKWMLFEGANSVQVLPYKGNSDALKGISRSVFPALYYRFSLLMLGTAILLTVGYLPIVLLVTSIMSHPENSSKLLMAAASISMIAAPWFIICRKFDHTRLTTLFYPVAITLMIVLAFHSMAVYRMGFTSWKDRKIIRPK